MMKKNKKELAIIAAVIIIVSVLGFFRSQQIPDKVGFVSQTGQKKDQKKSVPETDTNGEASDEQIDEQIKVYITGEIQKPGVYIVKEADRLEDLISLAGGLTPEADRNEMNLAMRLEDEMKIVVPNRDKRPGTDQATEATQDNVDNETTKAKININKAELEELKTLSGIGERKAQAILEFRKQKKFKSIEEIKNVPGIGEGIFNQIKDKISVR